MIVIPFARCRLEVDHDRRYCQTVFDDGTFVPATPQMTKEYTEQAVSLGYPRGEAGRWAMCWQHEYLHSALAIKWGKEFSPVLWAVAHGTELDWQAIGDEEAAVLEVQSVLNGYGL